MTLDEITAYPRSVLDGTITAGKYIRLACQRFMDFLQRNDMLFDVAAVERVVTFVSHLKHFEGGHAGKPFTLQPWQLWIVAAVYGFKWKETGLRVTRSVYIQVARKNGKSALIAALALYELIGSGEQGAEVDVVANSAKQAHILFDMCRKFGATIDPKNKYLQRFRDRINFAATNSKIQVLASKSASLDGYNASAFIMDEVHEQKDSRLFDVLKSSQGMRQQALAILITTAGFSTHGFCYSIRSNYIDILEGLKADDTQFSAIYEPDPADDYKDPATWQKSSPNLGVTVRADYLQDQVTAATNDRTLEGGIKTKNFNMWLSTSDAWLQESDIQAYSTPIPETFFYGKQIYAGVDLASTDDLTAVSIMATDNGKYYFKTLYYLPHSALTEKQNRVLYSQWAREKYLTITAGNVTDYDYIIADLLRLRENGCMFEAIGYDKYNSTQWAIASEAQGLPLQPYSQALWNFNRPTKEYERLFKSGKVAIDANPITRFCFSNVALKYDHNENVKPIKAGGHDGKIDGVISTLEALGVYLDSPRYTNDILFI